jgi:hypothetical protein
MLLKNYRKNNDVFSLQNGLIFVKWVIHSRPFCRLKAAEASYGVFVRQKNFEEKKQCFALPFVSSRCFAIGRMYD